MSRFIVLLIACSTTGIALAQELIFNGGFEEHVCLPEQISEILCCKGWNEINWVPDGKPEYGTPDYFIDSALYNLSSIATTDCEIATFMGAATMRIGAYRKTLKDYREYLATRLLDPLVPGVTYSLSIRVNNGYSFPEGSDLGYGCKGLGIAFTTDRLTAVPHRLIALEPQLSIEEEVWVNEWTEYRFDFLADSAYRYMTIGIFKNDSTASCLDYLAHQSTIPADRSGYYFLDEISLRRKEGAFGDSVICNGDSAVLTSFYHHGQYSWIEASKPGKVLSYSDKLVVRPPVTSTYVVTSGQAKSSITVRVVPDKIDLLDKDTTICDGDVVEISLPTDINTFQWQDGNRERQVFLTEPGNYWVKVIDHHCVSTDSMKLNVKFCGCEPYIPNTFTPNDDHLNDLFLPVFGCPVSDYRLYIFNRWGEVVFEASSPEEGWSGSSSGRRVPVDSYAFLLRYSLYDGSEHQLRGILHLLR